LKNNRKYSNIFSSTSFLSFVNFIINILNKLSGTFVTFNLRPIFINYNRKQLIEELDNLTEIISIVMQGPIVLKNRFTYETLKLYKNNFPNSIIIYSTWMNADRKTLNEIEKLGVEIILNELPTLFGTSNINLQIVSTNAGIKRAKELGANYVLKCRSDQRFYSDKADRYLLSLLNLFPIKYDPSINQKMRIITTSLNTFKYRMYGMSDTLNFGHIDDMLKYWDADLDTRLNIKSKVTESDIHPFEFAKYNVCEVYLVTSFLEKIGAKINWTLEDSFKKYAYHFCIIDQNSLDLYWGKYTFLEQKWKRYSEEVNYFEELTFNEWLLLYKKYL
jgi:hypothetical protein